MKQKQKITTKPKKYKSDRETIRKILQKVKKLKKNYTDNRNKSMTEADRVIAYQLDQYSTCYL